jgi:single-stranded-DNA-specific exonuclease
VSLRSSSRLPHQRWQIASAQPDQAAHLAAATGLPPLLAQVLLNRGIDTAEAAVTFLSPDSQVLPSPLDAFPDLAIAVELLLLAIASQQKIAICGDYDADGMTSTALLLRALRHLGADVDYAIPSRMQEGYGINRRIVEEFHAEGIGLILTVDNGISAYDPIARARELGLNVIITDHHDVPKDIPPANAILNPKLIDENSVYRSVAGVGVAYILAICLAQSLKKAQDLATPLLELFTLGTIADLAPLTGVNRRWVRRGLTLLPQSQIIGVQALVQVSGLSSEKSLKPEAIGFRLGPRINAIGRIGDPQIIIELFTTEDEGRALELAMKCEQVNQLRQRLCELIEQEAIAWCEQSRVNLRQERVLVVVQPSWHHGVIGIVASRLLERYGVPVFIGTYEEEDPERIRGSARGIPEFNIFEALEFCDDLLDKYGGHRAAGGFSFAAANLDKVRSRLSQFANRQLELEHLKPLVKIDAEAEIRDLTLDLYEQIDELHPCGMENPDPVFWTSQVRVVEQKAIGQNQAHLKVVLAKGGASLKAIAWRWGEYQPLPSPIDIAYRLRLNEWNGTRSVELEVIGARMTSGEVVMEPPLLKERSGGEDYEPIQKKIPEQILELDSDPGLELAPETKPALAKVEFYYDARPYICSISPIGDSKELRIRNANGQVLAIQPQQRRGLLGTRREDAREVDISQPHYFNLIQAALSALELVAKGQQIQEKEWMLAAQEQKIAELNQKLQDLQSDSQPSDSPQSDSPQSDSPQSDSQQILQTRSPLLCISTQSQKDLVIANKAKEDFAEAATLLCNVVERDVVQAFFKGLYQFAKLQSVAAIGGVPIKARKKYTLEILPPLLAREWRSFSVEHLARAEQSADLYCTVMATELAPTELMEGDRALLRSFLEQWDYPLAQWLLERPSEVAAIVHQVYLLRQLGKMEKWQFELLKQLVMGQAGAMGE